MRRAKEISGMKQVCCWHGKTHHLDIKPEGPLLHALISRYPGDSRSFRKALLHARRMSEQSMLGFLRHCGPFLHSQLP